MIREPAQAFANPRSQVNAHRPHVAGHLPVRFLQADIQTYRSPRLPEACAKVDAKVVLSAPRRPAHHHAAAAVESFSTQHRVQVWHARGDPLRGNGMIQFHRGDRQHRDSIFVDQERGYSSAPCLVPRYLTRCAFAASTPRWLMRWSSRITQSDTYSSSPCRVSVPLPFSAVTTVVEIAILQPAKQADGSPRVESLRWEIPKTALPACPASPVWRRHFLLRVVTE